MKDINNVMVVGRLTADSELKFTSNQKPVLNFSIANNGFKEHVSFFNCHMWDKYAETMSKFLLKGKQVVIHGEIRQERWTDKDNNKRSNVVINVSQVQMTGSKNGNTKNNNDDSNFSNKTQVDFPDFESEENNDVPY